MSDSASSLGLGLNVLLCVFFFFFFLFTGQPVQNSEDQSSTNWNLPTKPTGQPSHCIHLISSANWLWAFARQSNLRDTFVPASIRSYLLPALMTKLA